MRLWKELFLIFCISKMMFCYDEFSKGKFLIYYMGKLSGSEQFSREKTNDGKISIDSYGEINTNLLSKEIDIEWESKLILNKDYEAEKYRLIYNSSEGKYELNVDFSKNYINYEIFKSEGKAIEKLEIEPPFIILDNNVYSHYFALIKRFNLSKERKQKFSMFIPQNKFITEIFVEDKGFDKVEIDDLSYQLRKFFVNIGGFAGFNIWTDNANELIKISFANGIIEVKRVDYIPKSKRIKEGIKNEIKDYIEEEISFQNGNVKLSGTISFPKKKKTKHKGVVIISGSGQQDRDGNSPHGFFKTNIYKEIAMALSTKGLAVLRYDDRGVGKSTGNFQIATLSDFVSDAKEAIKFLRGRDDIDHDKITLIGHSEGGIIAGLIAREDPSISEIVLMGTPSKSLKHVLKEQLDIIKEEKLREVTKNNQEHLFKAVENGLDWTEINGKKIFLGWYKEHFKLEPLKVFAKLKCRVIILQGENDKQVLPYHALEIKKVLKEKGIPYKIKIFKGLDHLFMESSGAGIGEYFDNSRKLNKDFLKYLSNALK